MGNPRHVFKPEGNSWIQQLEDQIVLGPSHVFVYIKTDGYKRFVAEDILFLNHLSFTAPLLTMNVLYFFPCI